MKRLIVCCDGTWQSEDNDCPTNVLKIAQAIKQTATQGDDPVPQVLYYDEGIGAIPSQKTEGSFFRSIFQNISNFIEKVGGGAFGWWIDEKIKEAYIFLCLNYEPGDEIYLLGFSRGAYTVRSIAGLISFVGLLKRPDIGKTADAYNIYRRLADTEAEIEARRLEGEKFRRENADQPVEIKFLGCWDTVGALGIPNLNDILPIDEWVNREYQFHDTKLSPIIQNARHAIAIDELREAFDVTIMETGEGFEGTLRQVWFPGDHGCVGGGEMAKLGLSNAALQWMAEEASALGLELDLNSAQQTDYINSKTPFDSRSKLGMKGEHHRDITGLDAKLSEGFKFDLKESFHVSVKERWCDQSLNYKPANLDEFLQGKQHNWC